MIRGIGQSKSLLKLNWNWNWTGGSTGRGDSRTYSLSLRLLRLCIRFQAHHEGLKVLQVLGKHSFKINVTSSYLFILFFFFIDLMVVQMCPVKMKETDIQIAKAIAEFQCFASGKRILFFLTNTFSKSFDF